MQLSTHETIINEKKFIEAHTAIVEANKGNKTFDVYKERLEIYNQSKVKLKNDNVTLID